MELLWLVVSEHPGREMTWQSTWFWDGEGRTPGVLEGFLLSLLSLYAGFQHWTRASPSEHVSP